MTRKQRKDATRQTQRDAGLAPARRRIVALNVLLSPYSLAAEIAAQACRMDYYRHDFDLYTMEQRTQPKRATRDNGRTITDGQARASGRPLAPIRLA